MIKEQKENDWILNLLGNPQLAIADFKEVGVDANNTSLLDESDYTKSKQITENPLFRDNEGNFDSTKFHDFYEKAQLTYNMLANDTYLEESAKQATSFGYGDILAPREQRKKPADIIQIGRTPNQDRTTTGLVRIGVTSTPKWSTSEIAQREKVLANPVEAEKDPSKAIWHDSPNDSWFTDFFDTRVLAQWDEDGEHEDPVTGQIVQHKKGQLKLNDNGVPYYENLDGRDVYGRQVLNKMNTLTTDGSKWNRYDFFDSDDLNQKSIGGTVMKNLALVGSMFIPYVGPYIAGVSVASQLVGLAGTLGKMLTGSESPTFSAMEGWSKSVNRQTAKSQYAQENTWCWENFISLIGDVAGQLKEQRFIFEFAPAMFKGNSILGAKGLTETKRSKYIAEQAEKYKQLNETKLQDLIKNGLSKTDLKTFSDARSLEGFKAAADYDKFFNSYKNIGEILSKGYMTAITVGDTYGEAKQAGATDLEATMLTLGYAAAEAALLNTGLGEWILPELKANGLKNKAIINALTSGQKEIQDKVVETASKKQLVKHWFNRGKKLATDLSLVGKGLGGQMISGGLGEGFEETTEELLADFSKSCFNLVQYLKGSDNRMDAWSNMFDRYSISFLGGAVGGGLTAAGTNFKNPVTELTPEQARQQLVYKIRNNEEEDLLKTLDKMTFNSPYLSNEEENGSFKPSNESRKSKDDEVKQAFRNQVKILKDIVQAEGLKIPDSSFLDAQTFKDVTLQKLQDSPLSTLFLQDYNTLCSDIVKVSESINNINNKYSDSSQSRMTEEDTKTISDLNIQLNELRKKKDEYLNGTLAMDYVSKALFDLTPAFSQYYTQSFFKDYVKEKYHRDVKDLNEQDLQNYRKEFDEWKNTEYKNKISVLAPIYLNMARNSGEFIQEFSKNYDTIKNNNTLQALIRSNLAKSDQLQGTLLEASRTNDFDQFMQQLSKAYEEDKTDTALTLIYSGDNKQLIDQLKVLSQQENSQKQISDLIAGELAFNIDKYMGQFKSGTINPEIKHSLVNVSTAAKNWISNKSNYLVGLNSKWIVNQLEEMGYAGIDENTSLDELNTSISPYDLSEIFEDTNFSNNFKQLASEIGYIKPEYTIKDISEVQNLLSSSQSRIDKNIQQLESTPYTDTLTFIQKYIQTNSDSNLDMPKLLEYVNQILDSNESNLEMANFDEVIDQLNEADQIISWAQGLVLGAQTDSNGTLGNLLGYNKTLNEVAKRHKVPDWIPLPEITIENSSVINQDLDLLKNKIQQAKNIYAINQGKKLTLQNRTAANKQFIEYNRLKHFIVNIGDEWKNKNKLQEALESASLLKSLSESRDQKSLTDESRKQLEQENSKISDAIYDFFNDNQELIEQGKLSDLFKKGFDLYSSTNQVINDTTEKLDDENFIWWLASRAAIKSSSFYKEFEEVIDPEKLLAPIPIQEEAVFQNIAEVLNGNTINKFKNAYVKAAIDNFNESSEDEKIRILKEKLGYTNNDDIQRFINTNAIASSSILPQFDNIHLTEGIPGGGKSSAVNYYTLQILKKFHPDLLRNVYYVHKTIKSAEEATKDFGIENIKLFDKDKFMSLASSNYDSNRTEDSEGNKIYSKDDWIKDPESGKIVYKYKSNDLSEADIPSLIIIDEVSHYDEAELSVTDDLAKKYGITVLTAGDFDQSSTTALVPNYAGDSPLILSPFRSQFKHAPKIGISMRTANSQMDKTLNSFRTTEGNKPIYTYYFESPDNLTGAKIMNYSAQAEKSIDHIMSMLNKDEKVGFIYYDINSPTYQYLTKKYEGRFEPYKGTAAQGTEGRFYIADFYGSDNSKLKKDLYTAITRAQQASLVLNIPPSGGINIQSIKEDVTTNSSFSKPGLINYSKKRKSLLHEFFSTVEPLKYIKRESTKTVVKQKTIQPPITPIPQTNQKTEIKWDKSEEVLSIKWDNKEYETDGIKVYQGNNEVDGEIKQKILNIYNNLKQEKPEVTLPEEFSTSSVQNIVNNLNNQKSDFPEEVIDDSKFTYLFHSHNTFELGMRYDRENNKLEFPDNINRYTYRIDSAIGLAKIFEEDWKNPKLPADFYINIIKNLRGYLLTIDNKPDLLLALSSVLNPDETNPDLDVQKVEFGLLSAPNISTTNKNNGQVWGYKNDPKGFGVFDKSDEETTIGNANPSKESQSINRKTINAILTLKNNKRVAIPLFVLGNLETYTRNPKNKISEKLAKLYNDSNEDPYKFHKSIIEDEELQKIPEVYNLAKLFLFTNAGYFKIDDDSWIPSKGLTNWGIQINSSSISGEKFPFKGKGTPLSDVVKNSEFIFSKQLYTSIEQIADNGGNLINFANIGHTFILATQDPTLNTDEKMQEQYERQLIDPNEQRKVTLLYVTPPTVSTKDFLINLYNIVKETDPDKRINIKKLGSHLTSYYIWKGLLPELKKGNNILDALGNSTKEKIIGEIERLQQFESQKSQLLNEVMSSETWQGINTGKTVQSLQQHLNYALLSTFMHFQNNQIIQENLDKLVELINSSGLTEFHYSVKFKNRIPGKNKVMIPLETDQDINGNSLYTIDGKPFMVFAKLDSSLFSQNNSFNTIIKSFVDKIIPVDTNHPRESSKDTLPFMYPLGSPSHGRIVENNDLGINEIQITNQNISINGKVVIDSPTYIQNLKDRFFIQGKFPTIQNIQDLFKSYKFNNIDIKKVSEEIYNNILRYFNGDNRDPQANILSLVKDSIIQKIDLLNGTNGLDKYILLPNSREVRKISFTKEQLEDLGISEFIIPKKISELKYDGQGILTIDLNNNIQIQYDSINDQAQLIKQPDETNNTSDYDEMPLDPSSPIINLFNNIGYEDFPAYQSMYDWIKVSDMKGSEISDDLTEILKTLDKDNPNRKQLEDLLNYLNEDNEYCIRVMKSIL